ncbi:MAG: N-6 DNA methylase [Candidatus Saccharimonadia bacterium]
MSSLQNRFKRIDSILLEDAGTNGANDYITQISWLLFLKYIDDNESNRKIDAELAGKTHENLFKDEFMWRNWASPKKGERADISKQLTGHDLIEFVNKELFPYLKQFKNVTLDPKSMHYKIGEIFGELNNEIVNGHNLRDAIDIIDEMEFKTQDELDDLSHLYEERLKLLGGAGRSGEFYTPRPLIKIMIKALDPMLGKTIYDGAAGTAGFLTEAYEYLRTKVDSGEQLKFLKEDTFFAKNKKPEPYLLGTMNMILHGIESPNMVHGNTLTEDIADLQEKDKVDYILANPPFGGSERPEIRKKFPIETGETAYLFLQHFMKKLKVGGSAAIVIKNTFLNNGETAAVALRKEILENYNLHTIFDLPGGIFTANGSTGVKTVALFFTKGQPTTSIWYYELNVGRNLGKTNPLNSSDLLDFLKNYQDKNESDCSWNVDVDSVNKIDYDLSVNNPHVINVEALRSPKEILDAIKLVDQETYKVLGEII